MAEIVPSSLPEPGGSFFMDNFGGMFWLVVFAFKIAMVKGLYSKHSAFKKAVSWNGKLTHTMH